VKLPDSTVVSSNNFRAANVNVNMPVFKSDNGNIARYRAELRI
jgi:hypothetical protein